MLARNQSISQGIKMLVEYQNDSRILKVSRN